MIEPDAVLCVGLGEMGLPIARHLSAAGFKVRGWDASESARDNARNRDVECPSSLRQGLESSSTVFVNVGTESAIRDAMDEVLNAASPGTLLILISTCDPSDVEDFGKRAVAQNLRFLDSPVCRAASGARDGTLLALAAGSEDDLEQARPTLSAFCSDIRYVGTKLGWGQVAKSANNLILWATVLANEEALTIASDFGLDEENLRSCLGISTADNWSLREWHLAHEWKWSVKDLQIIMSIGRTRDIPLPVSTAAREQVLASKVLTHVDLEGTFEQ